MLKICLFEDCDNLTEGQTDHCASHNRAIRKAEKKAIKDEEKRRAAMARHAQTKPPAKKIKPVSTKRAQQMGVYSKLREVWLKKNPVCACCGGVAIDCHHMEGRENDLLLKVESWLPVCSGCHREITDNSAWAIEMGYSLKRTI